MNEIFLKNDLDFRVWLSRFKSIAYDMDGPQAIQPNHYPIWLIWSDTINNDGGNTITWDYHTVDCLEDRIQSLKQL